MWFRAPVETPLAGKVKFTLDGAEIDYDMALSFVEAPAVRLVGGRKGLSPKALTMAEIFKSWDYQTAIVGKWHLGDRPQFLPHRQGFDHTCYINKSNKEYIFIIQELRM